MDNKLKSKTRLAAIQLVTQHLINNQDIELIKYDFDKFYRNTVIDENLSKIEYNINFLSKLISFFKVLDINLVSKDINNLLDFNRKFENWDTITKAIILVSLGEIKNSEKNKIKIILNDYIEISKSFLNLKETKLINSILDKLIK
ncbi:MAG: hypothetical protein CFH19_01191 [Alphaproteobacteria bacterium MarineAlpha5_Bin9]|nr:MAG: hypothetical protein CFH19_01191 [Alphaproteobacteria bacterium MarineAlpha5_Bin9]|tara:strand:+ start:4503 stop:4937 length:435 start_codon:yes stop_codon:yes gene_type:complete